MPILGSEDEFFATGFLNSNYKAIQFSHKYSQHEGIVQALLPFTTQCSFLFPKSLHNKRLKFEPTKLFFIALRLLL